jgi:hypothetical protein
MPMLAPVAAADGVQQVAVAAGGFLQMLDGVPVPSVPSSAGVYTLQFDFGTGLMSWVLNP